jgi:HPt (histidine-containing phosphotransfer) domain-containing protein
VSGEASDVAAITAALWERFRPLVSERVGLLRAWAAGDGAVSRPEAARAAHNLAGSLGSYGRAEASAVARRADVLLASTAADDEVRPQVAELVGELDRVVQA